MALQTLGGKIYLSGVLQVEDTEDLLTIINPPDQFPVVQLTGNTLTLTACPAEKALPILSEAWGQVQLLQEFVYFQN